MSLHVGRIGNYKPLNFGGFVESPLSSIADNIDTSSKLTGKGPLLLYPPP